MLSLPNNANKLAIDANDVGALRVEARKNSPEALKQTARQFEALFMNMIMKSMREATPQDGMFDNQQTKMYTSMLDQQMSQNLAKRGIGLADMLVRQLSNQVGKQAADAASAASAASAESGNAAGAAVPGTPATATVTQHTAAGLALPAAGESKHGAARSPHVRAFQDRLGAHAEEASRRTGIPAKFMLGQAALESGWGRREIAAADGSPSHNLFGIKATPGWKGQTVDVPTTEYVGGVAQTQIQKFRVYGSYAESFQDYAQLLASNPRYEKVLANAQDANGFAQGLQNAGYATDPNYAAKLMKIIKDSLST